MSGKSSLKRAWSVRGHFTTFFTIFNHKWSSYFVLRYRHFWRVSAANATRLVGDFILAGEINFLDCLPAPHEERTAKSIGPVRGHECEVACTIPRLRKAESNGWDVISDGMEFLPTTGGRDRPGVWRRRKCGGPCPGPRSRAGVAMRAWPASGARTRTPCPGCRPHPNQANRSSPRST